MKKNVCPEKGKHSHLVCWWCKSHATVYCDRCNHMVTFLISHDCQPQPLDTASQEQLINELERRYNWKITRKVVPAHTEITSLTPPQDNWG